MPNIFNIFGDIQIQLGIQDDEWKVSRGSLANSGWLKMLMGKSWWFAGADSASTTGDDEAA